MKRILFILSLFFISQSAMAQTGYAFRVKLCDKNGGLTIADSLQFLSQKSLDRRSKQGIVLDNTDLPVVQLYVDSVMNVSNAVKLHNKSKWFNQVVVITYDSTKINDVLSLPFVCGVQLVADYPNYSPKTNVNPDPLSQRKFPKVNYGSNKTTGSPTYYGHTFQQINMLHADCLHDLGFKGEDMTVAVLDAGFNHHDTHTQFDSLRNSGRLLATYNFVKDTSYLLTTSNDHGTNVMSIMIAEDSSSYVGIAPKANIYALMTEDVSSEQPIEEDNWLSGAEWADSAGVDIINGSLGYNQYSAQHQSYTYAGDFDGNSTLIARAANMAVSKGIFTSVAQGNTGASSWFYMLTPADADSAFSVGSVDGSGAWAQSGYGPNADGQLKPNGVALGKQTWLIGGNGLPGQANGSSFASPLIAGAVACLWQALPDKSESYIRHLIMQVSDRYTNPNNTLGYGLPNFCMAYNLTVGTDDFENNYESNFEIYPVPTSGSFSVRVKQAVLPYDFEMYDVTGKLINKVSNINNIIYHNELLTQQPSGTYLIRINSKKGTEETQIIKQ